MEHILLFTSIIYYLWVMYVKRIPMVSLYTLFGVQWLYYWLLLYLLNYSNLLPSVVIIYPYMNDKNVLFYFFLFCALSMFIFASGYLLLYKNKAFYNKNDGKNKQYINYSQMLFSALFIMSIVMGSFSLAFPYLHRQQWGMQSLMGNLFNIYAGIFVLYMLISKNKISVIFLYLIFCVIALIDGSRVYLVAVTASLVFYLYDIKMLNYKGIITLFLIFVFFLSFVGLYRSGRAGSAFMIDAIIEPFVADSVFSSYSLVYVTNLWLQDSIKYYTLFSHYFVDPLIIFTPQVFFQSTETKKDKYNILGKWENDHGGVSKISPQGGFFYLAEAMIACALPGVIIVSFIFSLLFMFIEKLRSAGLWGAFIYYNFAGTFGTMIVCEKFSWVCRYFIQEIVAAVLLWALLHMFRVAIKRRLILEDSQ